ncbi:MAG TPA: pyridoxal phosphate-dependent aminotransferase, partial [Candidatus Elarobacter sp.]|nr:pyridoxal phosphate-dependent aminotransferase [Candidatus Elarobacter sp.]
VPDVSSSVSHTTPSTGPDGLRYASRLDLLSGEGALDVLLRARELERAGRDVVHLEIGEPNFATPEHIVEAGIAALHRGETHYGPPAGIPELREAIVAAGASRGIAATADQVVVTPGAKPAVFYAIMSLVSPGDEVLVPDPGFPIYPSATRFAGGTPVGYPLDPAERYAIDVDALAARITPRTRVLIVNAPHNPTGGSIDQPTIDRIAELAEAHDLAVISDEIYARLTYDERGAPAVPAPSLAAHPALRPRTLLVDGFSKTYAMTGWRLGYLVVPPSLVSRVTTLAINGHTCTPEFVQRAGIAALTGPAEPIRRMHAELAARRQVLVGGLAEIPGVRCAPPPGAFYAFADFSELLARTGLTATELASRMLQEHGVAALAGTAFGAGGEGHLRLSFAGARAELERAIPRIRECATALGAR